MFLTYFYSGELKDRWIIRRKAPHCIANVMWAGRTARQDADAISHPSLRNRIVSHCVEWSRAQSQTGPFLSPAVSEMSDCDADTSVSRPSPPAR